MRVSGSWQSNGSPTANVAMWQLSCGPSSTRSEQFAPTGRIFEPVSHTQLCLFFCPNYAIIYAALFKVGRTVDSDYEDWEGQDRFPREVRNLTSADLHNLCPPLPGELGGERGAGHVRRLVSGAGLIPAGSWKGSSLRKLA
jgi:hypothetical protein